MSLTLKQYLKNLQAALDVSLCLRNFPSMRVEKHNKPEVEMLQFSKKSSNTLTLNPIFLARSEGEHCLIEPSINSVRISFVFKKPEPLDKLIISKITKFFERRAERLLIFRRMPIKGYDCSLLITDRHLEKFNKKMLIEWIMEFVETMDQEVTEIRLNLNTQTRVAAGYFVEKMAGR